MYLFASGIDIASFYNFDISFWNFFRQRGILCFFIFTLQYLIYSVNENNMRKKRKKKKIQCNAQFKMIYNFLGNKNNFHIVPKLSFIEY